MLTRLSFTSTLTFSKPSKLPRNNLCCNGMMILVLLTGQKIWFLVGRSNNRMIRDEETFVSYVIFVVLADFIFQTQRQRTNDGDDDHEGQT